MSLRNVRYQMTKESKTSCAEVRGQSESLENCVCQVKRLPVSLIREGGLIETQRERERERERDQPQALSVSKCSCIGELSDGFTLWVQTTGSNRISPHFPATLEAETTAEHQLEPVKRPTRVFIQPEEQFSVTAATPEVDPRQPTNP